MTRPLTCLTLIAAAGAGLYLYQEKHRAQMMDREINRTVHATEQTRDRIGMMRAEWALLNEPERLAGLATTYLASLQTMTPGQFAHIADLGSRLPPVGAPTMAPAAIEPDVPVAAIAPATPVQVASKPEAAKPAAMVAQITVKPEPARHAAPTLVAQSVPAITAPARPVVPVMAQATTPAPRAVRVAARPHETEPVYRAVYAPVVQAYASQTPYASQAPVQMQRQPVIQQASAGLPSSYGGSTPYVGSALGMARMTLPAPIPVGASPGR